MKLSLALAALSLGRSFVDAFPSFHNARNLDGLTPEQLRAAVRSVHDYQKTKRLVVDFTQPIDITGKHAFAEARATDMRGPCPGLNALANHGYISRNGITSFAEVVTAINQGASINPSITHTTIV